ncbi:MAG: ATP-binding protein [Bacteroidota bacterium]
MATFRDRRYLVLVILCQLCLEVSGQSFPDLPQIEPSHITTFTAANGLPVCLQQVFFAPNGRTYVTNCGPGQGEENTYLYEYDGYRSIRIPFHQLLGDAKAVPLFIGINDEGALLGRFEQGSSFSNSIFILDLDKLELKTYSLPKDLPSNTTVLTVNFSTKFGYTILASNREHYYLLEFSKGEMKLTTRVDAYNTKITDNYIYRPVILRTTKAIWFWGQNKMKLWRYDLEDQTTLQFDCPAFFPSNCDHSTVSNKSVIDLFLGQKEEEPILRLFKEEYKYFQFDTAQKTFSPISPAQAFSFPYPITENHWYNKDRVGNILLVPNEEAEKNELLLKDAHDNNWFQLPPLWDLTKETGNNPRSRAGNLQGRDFRQTIISRSLGGITFIELKPLQAIQSFPIGATRSITQLSEHRLLVKKQGLATNVTTINIKDKMIDPLGEVPCLSNSGNILADIVRSPDNLLFINGKQSLIQFDPQTEACHVHEIGFSFSRFTLLKDGRMAIISDEGNKLYYFDLDTKKTSPALSGKDTIDFRSTVYQIKETSDGQLWVGTQNGIWKINPQTNILTKPHPHLPFQSDVVYFINEGEDGHLWLGTGSKGLHIYDPETGEVKTLDKDSGLSNNTIVSILNDAEGVRWVNTYHGLNLVSPKGELLVKLYEEDGLANNEGNRFSSYQTDQGQLVFGSINGVTVIDPVLVKKRFLVKDNLQIVLTELSYFNPTTEKDTFLRQPFEELLPVKLPAAKRYLKLRVSLSDLQNIQDNQYEYRLEYPGEEKPINWTFLGNRPEISLIDLPAGKYDLVIRGKNYRGQVAKEPIRIAIHAKELFYKTTWFLVLMIFIVSALPLLWLIRERRTRRQLEIMVKERTKKIERDKAIIEEQAKQLKSLDEAKSRFFANISHEFRTPLTIISGMADQIEKQPDQWLGKGVKMIRRSNSNLLDLVNQILDLQKLEAGSMTVNWQLGDILPLLRNLSEQFEGLAISKRQTLTFASELEQLEMDHDPEKIMRIVSNLLSNAIKYSPEKGQVTFKISEENQVGRHLEMAVQDSGPGINAEEIPYIFNRFYRVSDDKVGSQLGTGIGLSLTNELVQLLGGSIEVDSQIGKGSSFRVLLPITKRAAPMPTKKLVDVQTQVFGTEGPVSIKTPPKEGLPHALIVEDNPDIAQYLSICLAGHAELQFASNGQEGIDQALETIPDIIISDVMMPLKDGLELCETLKQDTRTSHVPIILLTAKSDVVSRIAGLRQGADDYLAKPFHEEELLVRMQNLLNIRRQLQARYRDLYNNPLPPPSKTAPNQEDAFILQLQEIFEEHQDDSNFDLNLLSQKMYLSRSQLGRKVKALTGKSLSLYLRLLRLQKGRHLLLTTDLSVKEVAYDVGFTDPNYFTRAYVEEYGENPSKTRGF